MEAVSLEKNDSGNKDEQLNGEFSIKVKFINLINLGHNVKK